MWDAGIGDSSWLSLLTGFVSNELACLTGTKE
jgi:hypothetical protein